MAKRPPLPVTARVLAADVLARADDAEIKPRFEAAAARLADPRDRALLKELVYGTLRWRLKLDDLLARASGHKVFRIDPGLAPLMRVAAHQLVHLERVPAHAAVDEAVTHAKLTFGDRRAGFVNAVLRNLVRRREPLLAELRSRAGDAGLAVRESAPTWLLERWRAQFGAARLESLAAAFNRPASLTLAPLRAGAPQPGGAQAAPLGAARFPAGEAAGGRDSLAAGEWYAADLASLAAARALADALAGAPDGPLLDGCAAPGGKSLLLRAAGCTRPLIALEPARERIAPLRENAAKLDLPPLLIRGDLARPPVRPGACAAVWVDAPCSAAGTLRKSPEKKWTLEPEAPALHAARQRELLAAAAPLVKPGGLLAYSVCTPLAEETRDVADEFLAGHPDFSPRPLGGPAAQLPWEAWGAGWLALPDREDWEGFFLAIFARGS